MLHSPSQDISTMMTTPQIDIKTEKSRGKDRLDDAENKTESVTTVEKLGTLEKYVGNYTVILPRSRWQKFRYYEISCTYNRGFKRFFSILCLQPSGFSKEEMQALES